LYIGENEPKALREFTCLDPHCRIFSTEFFWMEKKWHGPMLHLRLLTSASALHGTIPV